MTLVTCLRQVVGNTHAGIGLKGSSNALFDSNYISDGSGYGIWVQVTSHARPQSAHVPSQRTSPVTSTQQARGTRRLGIWFPVTL